LNGQKLFFKIPVFLFYFLPLETDSVGEAPWVILPAVEKATGKIYGSQINCNSSANCPSTCFTVLYRLSSKQKRWRKSATFL
jgi:hypothetical protein